MGLSHGVILELELEIAGGEYRLVLKTVKTFKTGMSCAGRQGKVVG